jgi:hypothetical protein
MKQAEPSLDLCTLMMHSNLTDSEQFKTHRKASYSKLCATIELFSKANTLNKLPSEQSQSLISIMT